MKRSELTSAPPIHEWQIAFSQACNLRCKYCITGYGKFHDKDGYMPADIQEKVISEIFDHLTKDKSISIKFVIGETFLYFDEFIKFIRNIKTEASKNNASVSISVGSNGVLLDKKKMDILADENIGIIFSIDGPQKIHDSNRVDSKGKGSFDKAYNNWKYYRHLSLNHPNSPLCNVQSVLSDGGSFTDVASFWAEHERVIFDCVLEFPSLYTSNGSIEEYRERKKSFLLQFKQFAFEKADELSVPLFLSNYTGPSQLLKYWTNIFLGNSCSSCKCADGIIAIDANGNYYPCDGFVGIDKWLIGNVFTRIDQDKVLKIKDQILKIRSECANCSIRDICEGGCVAATPDAGLTLDREGSCEFYKQIARIVHESFKKMSSEA